jgi:hypothetical protein
MTIRFSVPGRHDGPCDSKVGWCRPSRSCLRNDRRTWAKTLLSVFSPHQVADERGPQRVSPWHAQAARSFPRRGGSPILRTEHQKRHSP